MSVDLAADGELADAVREAARALCDALDRAGKARLKISCSVSPYCTQKFADGSVAQTDWKYSVSVSRINYV